MTHHCPRSNWTGPESELRKGICPKCAETTLYEDCSVRPMTDKPITFTDEQGNEWTLLAERTEPGVAMPDQRPATPDDLARAGYVKRAPQASTTSPLAELLLERHERRVAEVLSGARLPQDIFADFTSDEPGEWGGWGAPKRAEVNALRALYTYMSCQENDQWIAKLLAAVEEARK